MCWGRVLYQAGGDKLASKLELYILPLMTEEQLELHLIGVSMAQQSSMKKAKELIGDRTDAAVTRELNKINDFETYVPIKIDDL